MASYERKMQCGGWSKRHWRELRCRLKKEVKKELSTNHFTMNLDETPLVPVEEENEEPVSPDVIADTPLS
jgi:hypothetical protein